MKLYTWLSLRQLYFISVVKKHRGKVPNDCHHSKVTSKGKIKWSVILCSNSPRTNIAVLEKKKMLLTNDCTTCAPPTYKLFFWHFLLFLFFFFFLLKTAFMSPADLSLNYSTCLVVSPHTSLPLPDHSIIWAREILQESVCESRRGPLIKTCLNLWLDRKLWSLAAV